MKLKNYIIGLLGLMLFACQDDDHQFGDIVAPSNLTVTAELAGADADNPNGDGSGVVTFNASANNAISFSFIHNGNQKTEPSGSASFIFSDLGVNTYTITAIAYGTGGVKTSTTIDVDVLATYAPPPELLQKLIGDGTKTWRIKSSQAGHFGLGPPEGSVPTEWYSAGPNEKTGVGMYDDRYIFSEDGTFTFITDATNDAGGTDPSGTVFGRAGLIDQLGVSGGVTNGADIENLPYDDFQESWVIIGPGGVETISLTGLGFIGYYTGGSHNYRIFDWTSSPNDIVLSTTDGNGQFEWWFVITSE
ncbi:glucan endo-1,3-beta-D-glucosidase [Psychroflexus sp. YR1-1]|uniref:Glucan endo-1,3-beta-D-glucosidase n=1 Tax=Psychroflexus aurantiacus TaxID=2709310 RepID=A0A6B3R026_9FLAO|nr:glucan endo-1,3-beta-D-glucosidase [Psychroflexus aurantiacus]NEV92700.1 glucan endo-1,3-beta-D-glucosidase [Psychroflexus aurantiacus]